MSDYINTELAKTLTAVAAVARSTELHTQLGEVASICTASLRGGRKLLFAGNGGSAADAQHLAGELVSRFAYDRPGLPAFSLATDTSVLTAIGNDYGYERLFARQIEAVGAAGDVLIGLTTSGRSRNILLALEAAHQRGLKTVAFTGERGLLEEQHCQVTVRAPSAETPKIQEVHIILGHVLCGLIERALFPLD